MVDILNALSLPIAPGATVVTPLCVTPIVGGPADLVVSFLLLLVRLFLHLFPFIGKPI